MSQVIMDTDSTETENPGAEEALETDDTGEVQYVYDENSQMILGSYDFDNITDLVLEDGTRAMIVNGTLVTADGQALVLQDESSLSQYYIEENADEIFLSNEQDQFLEVISPQTTQTEEQIVQYFQEHPEAAHIQDENGEQVLYIQEDEQVLPPQQEEYQLAELDPDTGTVPMQVVKFENTEMVDEMGGVLDLDQFLSQQGLVQLENANYQYAVLKNGKLHIQTMDGQPNSEILRVQNSCDSNDQPVLLESSTDLPYVDVSSIKGKDMNTGQSICLSKYMEKVYSRTKVNNLGIKKEINFKDSKHPTNNTTVLKKLINKKITIGKTEKGQVLVGKILNVTKKTEGNYSSSFKSNKNGLKKSIKPKNKIVPPKEIRKTVFNDSFIKMINSENNNKELDAKKSYLKNVTQSPPIKSADAQNIDRELTIIPKPPKSYPPKTSTKTSPSDLTPQIHTPDITKKIKEPKTPKEKPETNPDISPKDILEDVNYVISGDMDSSPEQPKDISEDVNIVTSGDMESSPEQSKIVVHKKVVTKDCFDVITRTLTGLMNMDSVVKKLRNRTLIIRIIERIYNQDTGEYSKNISFCSGYMVREYKLNEEANNFSEAWRFIPDTNSQDTIMGEDNLETIIHNRSDARNNIRKLANLTIQITVNMHGNRTTRVIINPPNMYKCKECTKCFRTSSALKMHVADKHSKNRFDCDVCPATFETNFKLTEHLTTHQNGVSKGMYECTACEQRFETSLSLRKHMGMHFEGIKCDYCELGFSSMKELKMHLPIHTIIPSSAIQSPVKATPLDLVKNQLEQKIYCCEICNRQFSRYSNLQRHVEIHQGEGAMYKCAICNCSYHYVSSLTRHVVTCHVDTTSKRAQTLQNQVKPQQIVTNSEIQFLNGDQIVEMISLDGTEENFQYVNMTNVSEGLSIGDGVEVLEIPISEAEVQ